MNRLRQLREEKDLLQRDVARFLNISTSAYGFYETGARNMSAETASKLAHFFGVSTDYLLGVNDNKRLLPVLGVVKAGYDHLVSENIIDYIDPVMRLADPENYYGLVVKGDSMSPLFDEGDYLIVHKTDGYFDNNDICIVLVANEEDTVKKVVKTDDGLELHAFNPYYPVKRFTSKEVEELPVRIVGVVVRQIRNWK